MTPVAVQAMILITALRIFPRILLFTLLRLEKPERGKHNRQRGTILQQHRSHEPARVTEVSYLVHTYHTRVAEVSPGGCVPEL